MTPLPSNTHCQGNHCFHLVPALPSHDGRHMFVLCDCGTQRRVTRAVYEAVVALERDPTAPLDTRLAAMKHAYDKASTL